MEEEATLQKAFSQEEVFFVVIGSDRVCPIVTDLTTCSNYPSIHLPWSILCRPGINWERYFWERVTNRSYHVTVSFNVDWWYKTSHWSFAVSWYKDLWPLPQKYCSLLSNSMIRLSRYLTISHTISVNSVATWILRLYRFIWILTTLLTLLQTNLTVDEKVNESYMRVKTFDQQIIQYKSTNITNWVKFV